MRTLLALSIVTSTLAAVTECPVTFLFANKTHALSVDAHGAAYESTADALGGVYYIPKHVDCTAYSNGTCWWIANCTGVSKARSPYEINMDTPVSRVLLVFSSQSCASAMSRLHESVRIGQGMYYGMDTVCVPIANMKGIIPWGLECWGVMWQSGYTPSYTSQLRA
jgi:hypothetical protein